MAEGDCPGASSAGAAVVRITRPTGILLNSRNSAAFTICTRPHVARHSGICVSRRAIRDSVWSIYAVGPTTAGQASFMIFLADLEFALTLGFIFSLSFLDYGTHQITSLSWLNESYSLPRVKSLSHRQEMVAAEEAK